MEKMTGLKHLLKAFKDSCQGLKSAFKSEAAFRHDLIIFVVGVLISFFLPLSGFERALMVFSLFLILLMELVNTAIEVIIDRISTQYNPLSKKAKDIGSSLVFLAFIDAILVWGLILF